MANLLKEVAINLSLIEQAKNKCLPDSLPVLAIARLWSNDNEVVTKAYTQLIEKYIISGDIETRGVTPPSTDAFIYTSNQPQNITFYINTQGERLISNSSFKFFLKAVGEWPINKDCLLYCWLVCAKEKKINGYTERNEDFEKWLKEKPEIDLNSMTWAEIHKKLIDRNNSLWISGFDDWKKQQKFHKGKRGMKKKSI